MGDTVRDHAISWASDVMRADADLAGAYGDYIAGLETAGELTVTTSHPVEWPYFLREIEQVTAAERLELQKLLSGWRGRRLDAVPGGYVAWPEDSWAAELDELAHDLAFERAWWLAVAPAE